MMSELFDEEVMREQYNIAENKKAKEEGRVEGKAEGLLEALSKLIANGMPENEAKKILGLAWLKA